MQNSIGNIHSENEFCEWEKVVLVNIAIFKTIYGKYIYFTFLISIYRILSIVDVCPLNSKQKMRAQHGVVVNKIKFKIFRG